ncbi:heterocyst frequency control protein PatD [Hyella patelloides]|nr:heterocyst frequency control protein PatD [Hyella patelloides]
MLSIIHRKAYQDFLDLLIKLENHDQNLAVATKTAEKEIIWQNLKQVFQQHIIPLTDENLDLATASRWISLQAEIQREFRLLNTDWLFLISSRQPATKQAREKSVVERLRKLIGYCQVMLTLRSQEEDG